MRGTVPVSHHEMPRPAPTAHAVRDRILAEARGNPLALLELPYGLTAAELAERFGEADARPLRGQIEHGFHRRVESLPDDTRRILVTAAADPVGDAALLRRAAERLGVDLHTALSHGDAAELVAVGTHVRFRHPLVRSAVYRTARHRCTQRVSSCSRLMRCHSRLRRGAGNRVVTHRRGGDGECGHRRKPTAIRHACARRHSWPRKRGKCTHWGTVKGATALGRGLGVTVVRYHHSVLCNGLAQYQEAASAAPAAAAQPQDYGAPRWALAELVEASARTGATRMANEALEVGLGLTYQSRPLRRTRRCSTCRRDTQKPRDG